MVPHILLLFAMLFLIPILDNTEALASEGPRFQRGINLSRVFGFPVRARIQEEYVWPPFSGPLSSMTDEELVRLANLGFDFVRLSVDPGPFIFFSNDRRSQLFTKLSLFIDRLLQHKLKVVIDVHPATYASRWKPEDILGANNSEKYKEYLSFLTELAAITNVYPSNKVALQLMNEPQAACQRMNGEDWVITQKHIFKKIRENNPKLVLIITGACWSSIEGLLALRAKDYDEATIYDVHFYDPHVFTHQSTAWGYQPLPILLGLSYPSNQGSPEVTLSASSEFVSKYGMPRRLPTPSDDVKLNKLVQTYYAKDKPDKAFIERRFAQVKKWADVNEIPPSRILIGEFGAIRWPEKFEDGSRNRWITDVRSTIEKYGFAWAFWDYDKVFGIVLNYDNRQLEPEVVKALGLQQ